MFHIAKTKKPTQKCKPPGWGMGRDGGKRSGGAFGKYQQNLTYSLNPKMEQFQSNPFKRLLVNILLGHYRSFGLK